MDILLSHNSIDNYTLFSLQHLNTVPKCFGSFVSFFSSYLNPPLSIFISAKIDSVLFPPPFKPSPTDITPIIISCYSKYCRILLQNICTFSLFLIFTILYLLSLIILDSISVSFFCKNINKRSISL